MKYNELHKELLKWKTENIITEEQFNLLNGRYKPEEETHPRFHTKVEPNKLLMIITVAIIILGTFSWIGQVVPSINKFIIFPALIFIVALCLYFGDYIAGKKLKVIKFLGNCIIIFGCILTSFIVFYADIKTNNVLFGGDWSSFMFVSSAILIVVAYLTREKVVLGYSLFTLFLWFISEGSYVTKGYANNWLGLTLPTRLFLFSLIYMVLGFAHDNIDRLFGKIDLTERRKSFSKYYYMFGVIIAFIPSWQASMGKWLDKPMFSMNIETLLFTIIAMGVAIFTIYLGLIKSRKIFLNLGIGFFILEVYGKFHNVLSRFNTPLYYICMFIVTVFVAIMVEYLLKHREELKEELLMSKKG